MKRKQTFEHLEKLIDEHQDFLQTNMNIHKEIKGKATNIINALKRFQTLEDEWQIMQQRFLFTEIKHRNYPESAHKPFNKKKDSGPGSPQKVVRQNPDNGKTVHQNLVQLKRHMRKQCKNH